jgi:hypothetical protein
VVNAYNPSYLGGRGSQSEAGPWLKYEILSEKQTKRKEKDYRGVAQVVEQTLTRQSQDPEFNPSTSEREGKGKGREGESHEFLWPAVVANIYNSST